MKNRKVYWDEVKQRWYADKDPNNKWTYTASVEGECILNNTTALSCVAIPYRMTMLVEPQVQNGKYLVFKVQGPFAPPTGDDSQEDAFVTLRTLYANGDESDDTLYFKAVEN